MKKTIIIVFITFSLLSCRKSDYYIVVEEVINDLGGGTGTTTWTPDNTYIIDGFVFVNDGQTLTIEPGTVIRARTGQGSQASALIVARGGKIIAQGTSSNPIIFTVEGDDLNGSVPVKAAGLWGGLIILGNAPLNNELNEGFIEGIPISEPRGVYGGYNEDDNSGILEYVSIRHGGTNIGEGNEINGLTLGGVGRKTIIDHVEVIANADDGVEIFGGTVNIRNVAVGFCGDDAFDFDEGYKGKCQFLFGLIEDETGDHIVEHSGNSSGYLSLNLTQPVIYNSSFISLSSEEEHIMTFDHNSGGIYRNSLFLGTTPGIAIEYTGDTDSYERIVNNELLIENCIFYGISANIPEDVFVLHPDNGSTQQEKGFVMNYFENNSNSILDPGIGFSERPYQLLPPTTVFSSLAGYDNTWFEEVSYKGAFGSNNWLEGWTLLDEEGIVSEMLLNLR